MQRMATIPTWSAIITGLIPSIRSLKNDEPLGGEQRDPHREGKLTPEDLLPGDGQQAKHPEVAPFQRQEREDESAGES